MIILITAWYPGHKAKEVAEMFLKQAEKGNPPYIKKWLSFGTSDGKDGMKGYNLVYIEKGHVDEGLANIYKLIAPYYKIEGYSVKFEVLSLVSEAAKMLPLM